MLNFLIVIPARFKSSRLPGKPLIKLKGIPMLVRTYNQCLKCAPKKKIVVATDNQKIVNLCNKNKIPVIVTSKNCLTGTDRVAEAAEKLNYNIIVNLQGDEPLVDPDDILRQ